MDSRRRRREARRHVVGYQSIRRTDHANTAERPSRGRIRLEAVRSQPLTPLPAAPDHRRGRRALCRPRRPRPRQTRRRARLITQACTGNRLPTDGPLTQHTTGLGDVWSANSRAHEPLFDRLHARRLGRDLEESGLVLALNLRTPSMRRTAPTPQPQATVQRCSDSPISAERSGLLAPSPASGARTTMKQSVCLCLRKYTP